MKKILCFTFAALSTLTAVFAQNNSETAVEKRMQVTTRLPGHVNPSTITVAVRNGMAVYQDDILIGPIDKIQNPPTQDRGLVMEDLDDRWPGGRIPFEIDEDFTSAYRDTILTALDYINGSTNLLLVPREATDQNWIEFEPSDGCRSYIGLQDSYGQTIELKDKVANAGDGCGFIQIIHEVAHAAGLWHEQCRADRDVYVNIHWDNIIEDNHPDFEKDIDENIEIGGYDFDSRMHYFSKAFAINKALPTITRKQGPVELREVMGNRSDYSGGDVWAINWLYPARNCPPFYLINRTLPRVAQRLLYEAESTIGSNTKIKNSNEITFDAGYAIILQPGFEVTDGAKFRAVIEGCGGLVVPLVSGESDEWYAQTGAYEDRMAQNLNALKPSENISVEEISMSIAPNPFSGNTTVSYSLQNEQPVSIVLMDATGKLVATPLPKQTLNKGDYQFNLEAGSLPAGMYFLTLNVGENRETKRLILTK